MGRGREGRGRGKGEKVEGEVREVEYLSIVISPILGG